MLYTVNMRGLILIRAARKIYNERTRVRDDLYLSFTLHARSNSLQIMLKSLEYRPLADSFADHAIQPGMQSSNPCLQDSHAEPNETQEIECK